MNFKKPLFIIPILLAAFTVLSSCEKKTDDKPKKKSNLIEIKRLITLGEKYLKDTQYDSSYYYFNKAKSLSEVQKDTSKIIYALLNLAVIEQKQGNYFSSENTILETFPYLKNNFNTDYHLGIYTTLGNNYLHTFDYNLAFYYNNLALNLKTNPYRKASIKNNIASIYIGMHDYQKAIEILLPLTVKKEVLSDPAILSLTLDNLGYSYFKINDSKSLDYLNSALKIRKGKKNNWEITKSYIHLSEYYKNKNPRLAYTYALSAYEKASYVNNMRDRIESLKLLIRNSSGNESKIYSEKYIHITDSINKAKQIAKNQFAKIKYDSRREKEENLKLKNQKAQTALELEKKTNSNLILSFLVITGLLSVIFIYYFQKAINKKQKLEISYDTETRIAKKLHDELANDVFHAMAFSETQDLSSVQNKEKLLHYLDTIYSRTRNISKENSTINTGEDYLEGLKEMISGFNTQTIRILVNGIDSISWNALDNNKKIILYRVIQELLVNMKKHSQCSLAVISFKQNKNKLHIDYSDNGIGIECSKINSGNGLQNVENRILSIKGTITFAPKSSKGFKISFIIPM